MKTKIIELYIVSFGLFFIIELFYCLSPVVSVVSVVSIIYFYYRWYRACEMVKEQFREAAVGKKM